MSNVLAVLLGFIAITWGWLNLVAIVSVFGDATLDSFQKKAQIGVVVLLPFIGAVLVISLVRQYSPEAVPKALMPWPASLMFRHSKMYAPGIYGGGGEGMDSHAVYYGGSSDSGGDGGD
ncbi:hypothetical protein BTA51_15005 [Hahella sp. CCB-MM4]|uniref:hypothetical protein n=1 Tax=Hahella sp. (strain CCB-MM4) TaxID=1926491 RepID=UPI000B9AB2C5|nr:hypothetical protein [Hahella sp. CCB-MM4]OZG72435.1 hypothetical protein BTA51_15005 [Hahella sp. CCB-MM4]